MIKHIPWVTVTLLFCLAVALKKVEGSGRQPTQPTQPQQSLHSKGSNNMVLPVLIIGVGVACILFCGDEKPVDPLPTPGPAVTNDVTPDNLKAPIMFTNK